MGKEQPNLWLQEHEAAGDSSAAHKQRRVNAAAQLEILETLSQTHPEVCVLGDSKAQSSLE